LGATTNIRDIDSMVKKKEPGKRGREPELSQGSQTDDTDSDSEAFDPSIIILQYAALFAPTLCQP